MLEGRVIVEVLTDTGSVEVLVESGCVLVVPRNHWHRHKHVGVVKAMYVTPGLSEMSVADDPRTEPEA